MTALQLLSSAHAVSLPTELLSIAMKQNMLVLVGEEGERIAQVLKARQDPGYLTRVRRRSSWSPLSFLGGWTNSLIYMHDLGRTDFGHLCLGEDGVVYRMHLASRSFYGTKERLESYDVSELGELLEAIHKLERIY